MLSTVSQKHLCPVCQQADQVQTLQKAYESGLQRFAPPAMPLGQVSLMRTMATGGVIIALCSFLLIVFLLVANMPLWLQVLQAVLTITAILTVLALSLVTFLRGTYADMRAQKLLPAWDDALANWQRLRYCKRDNVVFDPQQISNSVLSNEALNSLISVKVPERQADGKSASISLSFSS